MLQIELPDRYTNALAVLKDREVRYGVGGLKLFNLAEISRGQVGYSIGKDGTSFIGTDAGMWQREWILIGYDTGLGDPLILDVADPNLPVFTSMNGQGKWELQSIAISVEAFMVCFRELARLAQGSGNAVQRNQNALSDAERADYVSRINTINEGNIESDFWVALLEY